MHVSAPRPPRPPQACFDGAPAGVGTSTSSSSGIKPQSLDWIVSNPPVHFGLRHDFSVVQHLIEGAVTYLKPTPRRAKGGEARGGEDEGEGGEGGGVMWFVTQTYVPVGAMFAAAARGRSRSRRLSRVRMVHSDGRFSVWRAEGARSPKQPKHPETATPPEQESGGGKRRADAAAGRQKKKRRKGTHGASSKE